MTYIWKLAIQHNTYNERFLNYVPDQVSDDARSIFASVNQVRPPVPGVSVSSEALHQSEVGRDAYQEVGQPSEHIQLKGGKWITLCKIGLLGVVTQIHFTTL